MVRLLRISLVPILLAGGMAVAQAAPFTGTLSGANEAPPNASPGTGTFTIDLDPGAHLLRVFTSFSGLTSPTAAAHVHCCTATPGTGVAGVATATPSFPGFPLGVTAGTYDMTFDSLASATYNPAFITASGGTAAGAEAALLAGLSSGRAYLNIHTNAFPGGEVRGFAPGATSVPAPASLALVLAGAVAAGALRRRA